MTSLWFVVPAWQRYAIVAACLEQRRRVCEALTAQGVEAHQVVVADDENLDLARAVGAHTVECDNTQLGRRWNLGMEYAGAHGAEWIVQIGSDSWVDPAYFLPLPQHPRQVLTSPAYCAVTTTVLAELRVSPGWLPHSAGPYVVHRKLLEPSRFHTVAVDSRMTDTSFVAGIERSTGRRIRWQPRTVHPFQYVGFRVEPLMTTYRSLWRKWGVAEHEPWGTLARYYPGDLVEAARRAMT